MSEKFLRALVPCGVLLASCGSDVAQLDCAYVNHPASRASVERACRACTVEHPERAIDGDPDSFATIALERASEGTIALRFDAPRKLVYPGGAIGVLVSSDRALDGFLRQVQLSKHLRGSQVASNVSAPPAVGRAGAMVKLTLGSPAPADALEFRISHSKGQPPLSVRVHEFCGT